MWKEIKLWLTSVFIMWAFDICPNGKFKDSFAEYLRENITDLNEQIEDEFINPNK
jgi:uncharacterized protein YktB (UPF0637 family)